jgi:hypothetical protein
LYRSPSPPAESPESASDRFVHLLNGQMTRRRTEHAPELANIYSFRGKHDPSVALDNEFNFVAGPELEMVSDLCRDRGLALFCER